MYHVNARHDHLRTIRLGEVISARIDHNAPPMLQPNKITQYPSAFVCVQNLSKDG